MSNWLEDLMNSAEGKAFLHKAVDIFVGGAEQPQSEGREIAAEENRKRVYGHLGLEPTATEDAIREAWAAFSKIPQMAPAYRAAKAAYLLICVWRGMET